LAGKGIKGSLAGFFQSCLLGATVNSKQVFIIADCGFQIADCFEKNAFQSVKSAIRNPQSTIRTIRNRKLRIFGF
jgi:hypothetical protein